MFLHRRELHVLNNQRSGRDRERATRAKACFVMAVVLFWSVSVFSEPLEGVYAKYFATGNDLYRLCSEGRVEGSNNFCTGYVEGVSDAIDLVNAPKSTRDEHTRLLSPG